ncbi:MAG: TRAP transporter small permease [Sandaracinaceae bacterium]
MLIDALARAIARIEELCLAGGILAIAILSIANVVSRGLFGESLASTQELCRFLIVLVTFIGIGYAVSKGRHVRMSALYEQLPPRPRKALAITIAITTAGLLFALAYLAAVYALGTMRELGTLSSVLQVPLWIVYLPAPIGLALGGVQYVLTAIKNVRSQGVWLAVDVRDDDPAPTDGGV